MPLWHPSFHVWLCSPAARSYYACIPPPPPPPPRPRGPAPTHTHPRSAPNAMVSRSEHLTFIASAVTASTCGTLAGKRPFAATGETTTSKLMGWCEGHPYHSPDTLLSLPSLWQHSSRSSSIMDASVCPPQVWVVDSADVRRLQDCKKVAPDQSTPRTTTTLHTHPQPAPLLSCGSSS